MASATHLYSDGRPRRDAPSAEIRRDAIAGAFSVVAPQRGQRPSGARLSAQGCPFCPGNEKLLTSIVMETPREIPPGWSTRVVPNRYPILTPEAEGPSLRQGLLNSRPGRGCHEVIVEHPDHDMDLARCSALETVEVLATWRARHRALMSLDMTRAVVLFRNHGGMAGASIPHPHSQIVALPLVPPHMVAWRASARSFHRRTGRCVHCALTAATLEDAQRVVLHNGDFVVFVPFAPIAPFETWIVPRRHVADFGALRDTEIDALAELLGALLRSYRERLDDPEYNLVVHSAPKTALRSQTLHTYIRIAPRLSVPGGFELGSGIQVLADTPEAYAAELADAATTIPQ